MANRTIPVTLQEEIVSKIEEIAKKETSSRNRIIRIAILKFLENATKTRAKQ